MMEKLKKQKKCLKKLIKLKIKVHKYLYLKFKFKNYFFIFEKILLF